MRLKHTTLGGLAVFILVALLAAVFIWYNTSLKFLIAEKALLGGQSITIPVALSELQDLSKPAESETAAPSEVTQPHIAVLVTGLGMDSAVTQAALQLPAAVALGFSPYAEGLQEWAVLSKAHPLFMEMPVAVSAEDSGVHDLLTQAEISQNTAHLEWILSKMSGYAGIYTQADAKTLLSLKNISTLLDSLKAHNLLFIYGDGESDALQRLAGEKYLSVLEGSKALDSENAATIPAHWTEVENMANENGQALVISKASSVTIQALHSWIATLESKGLKIVPVTDIVRKIE